MTGLDQADIGLKAIRSGADYYLVKGRDEGPAIVAALRAAAGLHEGQAVSICLPARICRPS
jgi:hypothetical protein